MQQNGYWWASSFHPLDDGEPEIIYVHGPEASRLGDDFPHHVGEFDLLHRVDTDRWPQKGKLTEKELLDENYAVDPATVPDGYWWAIHCEDFEPLIVRVEQDTVYRMDCEDTLNNFEFLMRIDTNGWPT
ncbi:hypothetical protein [Mesorhizobium sp. LNJC394B00]|uniref:hypothetical protein n=1 Tax=Mesorhizobium sp. LNJC394B00 TaxID=1287274 RepID=UPI0003CF812A|nr:hypothetical protein [Mesorhizobium sp. LNJC394B00]ESY20712.1 hypothetical protein X750_18505 [Mesorhizobium sp. LNJC394B00]